MFTRDGGLLASGTLLAAHRVQWGRIPSLDDYAHEAFTFAAGNFHMPGGFMRGDQVTLPPASRAAALLFTGVASTNTSYLERPDLPGTANEQRYEAGFADYAGLNFAVGADSARQAESILAGEPTGTYHSKASPPLALSGIHDAVPGTFPASMTLYGYQFQFDNFGLNFLDSQPHDSLIDGSITLPYPSAFAQAFEQLQINCLGGLEGAEVSPNDVTNHLAYWDSTFHTRAIRFQRNPDELCNVTTAYLILGIETRIALVPETLAGQWGFLANGNLISRSVGLEGIDSRLKLPSRIISRHHQRNVFGQSSWRRLPQPLRGPSGAAGPAARRLGEHSREGRRAILRGHQGAHPHRRAHERDHRVRLSHGRLAARGRGQQSWLANRRAEFFHGGLFRRRQPRLRFHACAHARAVSQLPRTKITMCARNGPGWA